VYVCYWFHYVKDSEGLVRNSLPLQYLIFFMSTKTNIFLFLAPPTHQISKSAATTIQPHNKPFNDFPDVFPTSKNWELTLLKSGLHYHIILKNPNAVWKHRNIKFKGKFRADKLENLRTEEKSSHVYRS